MWKLALKRKNPTIAFVQQEQWPCLQLRFLKKMIKDVTGHKSSKALALYERPTLAQKQALSKVLAGGPGSSSSTSFSEEVTS